MSAVRQPAVAVVSANRLIRNSAAARRRTPRTAASAAPARPVPHMPPVGNAVRDGRREQREPVWLSGATASTEGMVGRFFYPLARGEMAGSGEDFKLTRWADHRLQDQADRRCLLGRAAHPGLRSTQSAPLRPLDGALRATQAAMLFSSSAA